MSVDEYVMRDIAEMHMSAMDKSLLYAMLTQAFEDGYEEGYEQGQEDGYEELHYE